jgi:hypothetical protein
MLLVIKAMNATPHADLAVVDKLNADTVESIVNGANTDRIELLPGQLSGACAPIAARTCSSGITE